MSPEWREGRGWLSLHVDEVTDVSGASCPAGERGDGPRGGDGEEDWASVEAWHHHAREHFLWGDPLNEQA